MKPIKLLISAFGPYADEMPEIDFRQFEDKGLFLISGDTGAGERLRYLMPYALLSMELPVEHIEIRKI